MRSRLVARAILCAVLATGGIGAAGVGATALPSPAPSPTPTTEPTFPLDIAVNGEGDFARILLRAGGWPVTGSNVCAVVTWEVAEGGHFVPGSTTFNPLNTSYSMPGDSVFNSHGVRNYPDWPTGLTATLRTLRLDFYTEIRAALADGNDGARVLAAVTAAPWGTKFPEPAGALSPCSGWAAEFDAARAGAQRDVDAGVAAAAKARERQARSQAKEAKLDMRHATMSAQIDAAKRSLSQFARSLYIVGVEPAVASQVNAIDSGDPIAYQILEAYPRVVADRDGQAVRRALQLLAAVEAEQRTAAAEVAQASAGVAAADQKLAEAQTTLSRIEDRAAELN